MNERNKNRRGSTIFLVILFLAGLSLLLYPSLSNFLNTRNQSHAIAGYAQTVSTLNEEKYEKLREEAIAYNEALLGRTNQYALPEDLLSQYENLLDVSGTGIMGYVEIPSINCSLPIYHGTDESVLQVAIGHLQWTSLPVGGKSTHSVISGHRGLPSAELLTHIDRLELGDAFYIHVLDEILEYRVDDIAVVEPEDTSRLRVVEDMDYMTLVTCTPYGINSHRLLVRGARVDNSSVSSSMQIPLHDEVRDVPLMYVVPLATVLLCAVIVSFVWSGNFLRRRFQSMDEVMHGEEIGEQTC